MQTAANLNGLIPICHPTWDAPGDGQLKIYDIAANSTDTYEQTQEYEVTAGLGVEVPKAFSINVSGSYKVSYTSETSVTDKFGTEITCSLANLNSVNAGPKISSLDVSTYWFRNNNNINWWFYKYFGDQHPWYIAYIINPTKAAIRLVSPPDHAIAGDKNMFFNWEDEYDNLSDYELVISNSSPIDNTTIICRQQVGDSKASIPSGFYPEAGKTYYWSVRAKTSDGFTVHSGINSFTVLETPAAASEPELRAFVFPNPGKCSDIHIFAGSETEENYKLVIYDCNGLVKARSEIVSAKGIQADFNCTGFDLAPGIYVATITAGNEKVVRKIIVN